MSNEINLKGRLTLEKNMQKFFFISIHKPPASIEVAPIKHALAVTVEPFKFSPTSRWLMNLVSCPWLVV